MPKEPVMTLQIMAAKLTPRAPSCLAPNMARKTRSPPVRYTKQPRMA
jgi:hypothetical protein